jgi:RNA polymerase sigma-70 factor (ECF subfamily)
MQQRTLERTAVAPAAVAADPAHAADAVQRHARGVFRFLRTLGAPAAVADDLAQEAFVVAWRKGKQGLPPAALGAFLRRTAKLLWLEHRRDQRREAAALANAAERLWERHCASDDGDAFVAAVARCLDELTPRARSAVERIYADDADRNLVAAELGLLPNGLKMLLQRARQAILDCVRRRR